ncbi:unnamed protein product [Mytilus coruscus]|uniref:Uncharacterized protein n=1 Tax=Mytilus coruscus TaxID=42192 RepID=A0A6J7ZVH7_MYTCO|nr:unnamed protein product [Mytilus coruscus]
MRIGEITYVNTNADNHVVKISDINSEVFVTVMSSSKTDQIGCSTTLIMSSNDDDDEICVVKTLNDYLQLRIFGVGIIGSSLITNESSHGQMRPMGNGLGLHNLGYKLMWAGMSGMSVYNVVPIVENLIHFWGLPDAVLLHCGGYDIGLVNCAKLLFDITFMLDIVVRLVNGIIKAHVVSSAVVPADTGNYNIREITVDVLEDFKNNIQGDRIILTTAEYSTFCVVSLPDDSCFVVSGTFEEGTPLRYRTSMCGFHRTCSAITDLQLSGLNGGYGEACKNNCKVSGKVFK